TRMVQKLLRENALDLGLTEGFVEAPDLTADVFSEDEIIAIIAAGHPLAKEESVPFSSLQHVPLLMREKGSGTREVVERVLLKKGVSLLPAMTLGQTEAIKRAVEAGNGWAFVSRLAVESELATGRLGTISLTGWSVYRPFHRLKLQGKYEGRAVREFLRTLETICTVEKSTTENDTFNG
ncbi:MAG TPA: LysR substrate-binding domain-containing protein, partial [Abditibacteriaceae bacterium]